jgi:phosphate transport system substrate-binding protein
MKTALQADENVSATASAELEHRDADSGSGSAGSSAGSGEPQRTKTGRAKSPLRIPAIIVSCLVLSLSLCGSVPYIVGLLNAGNYVQGEPDRTESINVQLERSTDWRRLVREAVISETELDIIDGSTATIPITAELIRQFYGYSDEDVVGMHLVWHSKTHSAYLHLIDRLNRNGIGATEYDAHYANPEGTYANPEGTKPSAEFEASSFTPVGLILVTPPSQEELDYAQQAGVTLEQTPVALDGFVFIVNRDNPVESLTLEQLRGIYTGKITNWQEVGGADVAIHAFQREKGSGSQTAMEQLVMEGASMPEPPLVMIAEGMGGLVERVAEYQNDASSIGYTYAYYLENLYLNENIKILSIEGVAPDESSYLDGSYPLTTAYYAVIRADEPEDSPARRLRDFLLTDTGQAIIEMAGYTRAVR